MKVENGRSSGPTRLMSTDTTTSLPSHQERVLLFTLAAVQFANVLDFMVMMPLGASIMTAFAISPQAFSLLVAAYGTAAAVSGFAGGFVLDRFDRKNALLVLFSGFTLATLSCALAPNYPSLSGYMLSMELLEERTLDHHAGEFPSDGTMVFPLPKSTNSTIELAKRWPQDRRNVTKHFEIETMSFRVKGFSSP